MEVHMKFENKTVINTSEDWWMILIRLRGEPKIVEEIKELIRKHMKERTDAQEY